MSVLELVLRIAALTQLSILSLILFRGSTSNRSYHYAIILLLGIASYMLAPLILHQWRWGIASYPVLLMAIVVPALFWFFVSAVFHDDFAPPLAAKGLVVVTAVLGFGAFCTDPAHTCPNNVMSIPGWLAQIAKLLWVAAAFVTVLKDWQADLVESRRRLRFIIVFAGGCYMVIVLIFELLVQGSIPAVVELLNVSLLFLAVSALSLHFLDIRQTNVFAAMANRAQQASPQASPLAKQVVALMENERTFAIEPLTIGILADQLRTQPRQLRQVINGELGFRNFNVFINLYRIKEVAQRLELAEYRNTPLLTLALDAGFRSLAPFNRSFKDHYGLTPSEYRQKLDNAN